MFFLENYYVLDSMGKGLTQLLIIMAVLQLVKKIPDIINTIFGTQIKDSGGIKGRLGQMAAIGGIAQKAWTSLGTGAKNLGKIGLAAPFVGAALGANAIYKHKSGGKNLMDAKAVRGLRAFGTGLGTATKTGSWAKAYEAGNAAYDKSTAKSLDKARFAKRKDEEIDNELKEGGKNGESAIKNTDVNMKNAKSNNFVEKVTKVAGKNAGSAYKKWQGIARGESIVSSVNSNEDAIAQEIREAIELHKEGSKERTTLSQALSDYQNRVKDANGNAFNAEAFGNWISKNENLFKDKQKVSNLIGENGKLSANMRLMKYAEANQAELGFSTEDLQNLTNRSRAAVGFLAKQYPKNTEDAKKAYELEIAGARLDPLDQISVEKDAAAGISLANSYGFAIGRKKNGESEIDTGIVDNPFNYTPPGQQATVQTQQPVQANAQPTPVSQSQQTLGGDTSAPDSGKGTVQPTSAAQSQSALGGNTGTPDSNKGKPEEKSGDTVITTNNYYGDKSSSSSSENAAQSSKLPDVKVNVNQDTSSMEEKLSELKELNSMEQQKTREEMRKTKASTDGVKESIEELGSDLKKPKDEE